MKDSEWVYVFLFIFLFSDDFLIIACDGVWDEVSDDDAVTTVRQSLATNGNDPYLVIGRNTD